MADQIRQYTIKIKADVEEALKQIDSLSGKFDKIEIKSNIDKGFESQLSKITGAIGKVTQELSEFKNEFKNIDFSQSTKDMKIFFDQLKDSMEEIKKSSQSLSDIFDFAKTGQDNQIIGFVKEFKQQMQEMLESYQNAAEQISRIQKDGFTMPTAKTESVSGIPSATNVSIKNNIKGAEQTVANYEEYEKLQDRALQILKRIAQKAKDENEAIVDIANNPDYALSDYTSLLDDLDEVDNIIKRIGKTEQIAGQLDKLKLTSDRTRGTVRSELKSRIKELTVGSDVKPMHTSIRFNYDIAATDNEKQIKETVDGIVQRIQNEIQRRVQDDINQKPIRIPISFGSYELIQKEKEESAVNSIDDQAHGEGIVRDLHVAIKANTEGLLENINQEIENLNKQITATIDVKVKPILPSDEELSSMNLGGDTSDKVSGKFTVNLGDIQGTSVQSDDRIFGLLSDIRGIISQMVGNIPQPSMFDYDTISQQASSAQVESNTANIQADTVNVAGDSGTTTQSQGKKDQKDFLSDILPRIILRGNKQRSLFSGYWAANESNDIRRTQKERFSGAMNRLVADIANPKRTSISDRYYYTGHHDYNGKQWAYFGKSGQLLEDFQKELSDTFKIGKDAIAEAKKQEEEKMQAAKISQKLVDSGIPGGHKVTEWMKRIIDFDKEVEEKRDLGSKRISDRLKSENSSFVDKNRTQFVSEIDRSLESLSSRRNEIINSNKELLRVQLEYKRTNDLISELNKSKSLESSQIPKLYHELDDDSQLKPIIKDLLSNPEANFDDAKQQIIPILNELAKTLGADIKDRQVQKEQTDKELEKIDSQINQKQLEKGRYESADAKEITREVVRREHEQRRLAYAKDTSGLTPAYEKKLEEIQEDAIRKQSMRIARETVRTAGSLGTDNKTLIPYFGRDALQKVKNGNVSEIDVKNEHAKKRIENLKKVGLVVDEETGNLISIAGNTPKSNKEGAEDLIQRLHDIGEYGQQRLNQQIEITRLLSQNEEQLKGYIQQYESTVDVDTSDEKAISDMAQGLYDSFSQEEKDRFALIRRKLQVAQSQRRKQAEAQGMTVDDDRSLLSEDERKLWNISEALESQFKGYDPTQIYEISKQLIDFVVRSKKAEAGIKENTRKAMENMVETQTGRKLTQKGYEEAGKELEEVDKKIIELQNRMKITKSTDYVVDTATGKTKTISGADKKTLTKFEQEQYEYYKNRQKELRRSRRGYEIANGIRDYNSKLIEGEEPKSDIERRRVKNYLLSEKTAKEYANVPSSQSVSKEFIDANGQRVIQNGEALREAVGVSSEQLLHFASVLDQANAEIEGSLAKFPQTEEEIQAYVDQHVQQDIDNIIADRGKINEQLSSRFAKFKSENQSVFDNGTHEERAALIKTFRSRNNYLIQQRDLATSSIKALTNDESIRQQAQIDANDVKIQELRAETERITTFISQQLASSGQSASKIAEQLNELETLRKQEKEAQKQLEDYDANIEGDMTVDQLRGHLDRLDYLKLVTGKRRRLEQTIAQTLPLGENGLYGTEAGNLGSERNTTMTGSLLEELIQNLNKLAELEGENDILRQNIKESEGEQTALKQRQQTHRENLEQQKQDHLSAIQTNRIEASNFRKLAENQKAVQERENTIAKREADRQKEKAAKQGLVKKIEERVNAPIEEQIAQTEAEYNEIIGGLQQQLGWIKQSIEYVDLIINQLNNNLQEDVAQKQALVQEAESKLLDAEKSAKLPTKEEIAQNQKSLFDSDTQLQSLISEREAARGAGDRGKAFELSEAIKARRQEILDEYVFSVENAIADLHEAIDSGAGEDAIKQKSNALVEAYRENYKINGEYKASEYSYISDQKTGQRIDPIEYAMQFAQTQEAVVQARQQELNVAREELQKSQEKLRVAQESLGIVNGEVEYASKDNEIGKQYLKLKGEQRKAQADLNATQSKRNEEITAIRGKSGQSESERKAGFRKFLLEKNGLTYSDFYQEEQEAAKELTEEQKAAAKTIRERKENEARILQQQVLEQKNADKAGYYSKPSGIVDKNYRGEKAEEPPKATDTQGYDQMAQSMEHAEEAASENIQTEEQLAQARSQTAQETRKAISLAEATSREDFISRAKLGIDKGFRLGSKNGETMWFPSSMNPEDRGYKDMTNWLKSVGGKYGSTDNRYNLLADQYYKKPTSGQKAAAPAEPTNASELDNVSQKAEEAKKTVIDLNNALESMKQILSSSGKEGLLQALNELTKKDLTNILKDPQNGLDASSISKLKKDELASRIITGLEPTEQVINQAGEAGQTIQETQASRDAAEAAKAEAEAKQQAAEASEQKAQSEAKDAESTKESAKATKEATDSVNAIKKFSNKINGISVGEREIFGDSFGKLQTEFESLQKQLSDGVIDADQFSSQMEKAFNAYNRFKRVNPTGSTLFENVSKDRDAVIQQLNSYIDSTYKLTTRGVSGGAIGSDQVARFSAQVVDANNNVQNLRFTWDTLNNTISVTSGQAADQFKGRFMSLISELQNKSKQLFVYWTATFLNPYRLIGSFKQVVNIVKEYDDAFTEMRKVSNETISTLKEFQDASFGIADSLGTTGLQIQKSTADWLRLGETMEEAKKSAEVSNLLLNVSEFDSIDNATQALVSASQAYKEFEKIDIVDKLNNIGNNFSISTDQLAEGLQNAAAVLKTSGNNLDQALAILTAGNAITQDISKTAAGVRTITLRIAGTKEAKEELEELGEDVSDFEVMTESKVDAKVRKFTATAKNPEGVSVLDSKGRLRDTYDILLDIAEVYDDIVAKDNELGTNTSNALLELLAGKTRSNILASILQNPQMLKDVYNMSKDSSGSAMEENQKYLDSISGKLQQAQNHLQEMANTIADSDGLKFILDIINQILKATASLVDNFGGINSIIGLISAAMLQKKGLGLFGFDSKNGFSTIFDGFKKGAQKTMVEVSKDASDIFAKVSTNISQSSIEKGLVNWEGFFEKHKIKDQMMKSFLSDDSIPVKNLENYVKYAGEAQTATTGFGSALGALKAGFAGIASTLLSTIAITVALGLAFKGIQLFIDNVILREQKLIEKGQEATQAIEDRYKAYQNLKDAMSETEKSITGKDQASGTTEESIKTIAEKYDELHDGVNKLSNANENLSTDKYQEYLDLCNQLAEQSPQLVTGWDAQGNAILGLGNTAAEAETALMRMYQAEKLAANVEIAQDIQDSYTGFTTQIKQKETENSEISSSLEGLEEQLKASESQQAQIENTISQYEEQVKEAEQKQKELSNIIAETPSPQMGPWKPLTPEEQAKRMNAVNNGTMTMAEAFPWLEESINNQKIEQAQKEFDEQVQYAISGWATISGDLLSVPQYFSGFGQELNNILGQYGLVASENGFENIVGEVGNFEVSGLSQLSQDELNAIQDQIAKYVQATIDSQTEALRVQVNQVQQQQAANDLYIQDQTKSIQGIISKYLTTSDVFTGQSDTIQSAILNNLDSLDLSLISEKYGGQIVPYIYGELIQPINDLAPDSQKALAKLFEIKPDKKTANEYMQSLVDQIHEVAGDDRKAQSMWEGLLGVDKIQDEISSAQSVIRKEFMTADAYGHVLENKLTDEQLEQLYGLSLDDLRIYADLVRDGVYETWEELQKAFEERKNIKQVAPTDTLIDLLNDEAYSDDASKFESNLSSLSGALETLRNEGSLTAEEMVKLQNSFPDLTEFTTEAIQTKAFEELDGWIGKIREGMEDMSEEGKEQARTMIRNMVDQYGDLGVSIGDIRNTYLSSQDVSTMPKLNLVTKEFDDKVASLQQYLNDHGNEQIDTHILYTLVAEDKFSGTAREILAEYKDVKLTWEIILENKKLEKDIEHQQTILDKYDALRAKKTAKGEYLEPKDYKASLKAAEQIVKDREDELENAKTIRDTKSNGSDEWQANNDAVIKATAEQAKAEAERLQLEKESIEAETNEAQSVLKAADNAVAEAQAAVDKAEAELGEGMADQKLYDDLAEKTAERAAANVGLATIWREVAERVKDEHPDWYNEFIGNAISAESSAQSDDETAKGYDNIESQKQLNTLKEDATKIQRNLTVAEQKHQKVSKDTYRGLINNARAQIKYLKEEQDKVKDNLSEWRNYQDQIDSLSDSIYDWGSTLDTLVYDQASQLASTLSTAMSEQFSETGLTTDTINALLTGFSDLTGKKLDVSDAFYNTADGVKVNTQALQELTEAEFELQAASITSEIERTQAALDQNPGDSALQQKLQKLMQTQAQYFAQYQEMQKALSYNNAIDLAEGTENAGANYDKNYERVKTYKEAREKGLIGTDDFKAWTSYLDVYGRDTLDAYDAVSGKIERYFTEEAQTGLGNFLTDMEKLGYAAQDADGYWQLTVDDYDAAAKDMQMGSEWFMDTLRKLEDFGMVHTYVSSLTEAQLKTQDAEEQIAEAMQTYGEMVRRGASEEDLQKQIDHIHELEGAWNDVNTVRETWDETSEANKRKDYLGLEDQLAAAQKMYEEADTDAGRKAAEELAQSYVDQWNYTLGEGADEGIFKLSEKSAEDYKQRTTVTEDSFDKVRQSVGETMSQLGEGGNVDLLSRPFVEAAKLAEAGWEDAGEGIATVFSSTYSNEDESVAMNFTPIFRDENGEIGVLSPGELEQYAQDVINGVHGDDLNLQIGAEFTGDDAISQAVENAERIHELQDEYYFGIDDFKQYYQNNTEEANKYLSVLQGASRETLEQISLSNGDYEVDKDVEDAFQGLADALGYTNENAYQLLDILGLIGESVKLPSQYEELENLLSTTTKGSGAGYQISTDLTGKSLDELNAQMSEIEQFELDVEVDPNSDVYQQLQQLKEDTQLEIDARIQQDITDSGVSTTQYKAWAQSGDYESIAKSLGIEVDSSELDQYINQINSLPDSFDMSVHIDDEQFTQLVSAITDPWSMLITADTSEAEQQTQEFQDSVEKKPIIQTIQQKIQNFGNAVAGFFGGGQKAETTAEMDTSGIAKGAQQAEKATKNVSKAKGTATADINIAPALMKISALKTALASIASVRPMPIIDQTSISNAIVRTQTLINKLNEAAAKKNSVALGTAHALGTTSLYRAYANGKNWTVGRNESALVNEIGQESRVRNGVWELIPGGPHVEDLKKDDIIFNAQQTADLIRTGKTARSGRLVAHANGTVNGMPAHATTSGISNAFKFQGTNSVVQQTNSAVNSVVDNVQKASKSTKKNFDKFQKWLEKLFDWIEVRLDRIQRRIDLATAKAETEIGDKEGTTGTISSRKNEHLDTAMKNIAASASEFQDTNVKVGKNGQVTGFTGKATSNTLLGDSVRGALRYQQQANKVAQQAYKSGIFGKNKKKMNDIITRIQNGTIDISEYNEKIRKFIDSYKEWYDKSQDLVQSTNELKKQYNDLQQQRLDNITEEYETLIDLYDAQKTTSESMIKYYQTYGQQVNSGDKYQLTRQRDIQNTTLNKLYEEQKKYQAELNNARNVFGANSNEYRAAQKVLEEINNNIYEAKTGILETNHQIAELAFTVRDFAINRLKTLVEKLATIASLSEKRGTNTKLGYQVTEGIYTQQIGINQDLIKKYQEQISKKKTDIENRIKNEGLRKDSQAYEDETKKISDWENQILSLLSANEDLRTSMRNLRWKGYTQLREELDNIKSDFEHIQSLIRDGEILDSDGALTERGYAKVALIGEEMLIAEKNISNAKEAMKKLKEEVDNGVISQETYNEEINTQIDLIQDNAKAVQDYQEALAKIKIDQMEKQNDALQDLIKARKDALNAKKEYYDWDKNLKSKNKDIAQLQAQINALNGVTNDAANARRAKLQAELAEKQEDLQDTLYEHSIEIQQEGYDKLSEDMQEALDKAIDLINGKQDALQDTADQMLAQLKTNTVDEKAIIDGIVQDRATAIHEETKKAINETLVNGNEKLADELGVGTTDTVGENIENISPNSAVTNIDTSLADYYAKESQQSAESESSNQDAIQAVIDNNNNISSLEKKADAAYEADLKVANEVANLINQLKSNSSITLASKSAVSTAQSKWNALTDNQKAILQQKDTYNSLSSKLTGASNTIKQLQDLKATTNMTLAQAKKAKEEADFKEARDKEIKKLKDTIDSYKKSINTITEEIKKLKKKKQTAKIKQQIDQKRNTREDYKSKLEYTRQTLKSKYGISYAKGSKRIPEDLLAWTNEDWDKYGSEIIVRPEDNAILTPLKANDSVIPANLADNLFKWGAISPDKFITNPFVGKWSSDGKGGSSITTDDSYIGGQTIEMHFDSLFHIEGNVDESVMPRLENLGKSLVNDRDFQKNVIKFVTKDFVRESKKQGIR